MIKTSNLLHRSKCVQSTTSKRPFSWRRGLHLQRAFNAAHSSGEFEGSNNAQPKQNFQSSSRLTLALTITIVIVLAQLIIVHYYLELSQADSWRPAATLAGSVLQSKFLSHHEWLCRCYPYLAEVVEVARMNRLELVVVDPDFLAALEGSHSESSQRGAPRHGGSAYRSHQEPGEPGSKAILHLAAINETSGGQPNLKAFYKRLVDKLYVMLKYEDSSQTIAPEVYHQRPVHNIDDVLSDALRDINNQQKQQQQRRSRELHPLMFQETQQISKIYTEFISHLFILNATGQSWSSFSGCCEAGGQSSRFSNAKGARGVPFVVIHIMVLYNYEYRPRDEWIQSSLHFDELAKHKLLDHGVHSVDFRVPLDQYYVHLKRKTRPLNSIELTGKTTYDRLFSKEPLGSSLKVFESSHDRRLIYANNSYLHCTQSTFDIEALLAGCGLPMSNYLRSLNAAEPADEHLTRARGPAGSPELNLREQLSLALQFVRVLSSNYHNFTFWITGSNLLAYHKFCQLTLSHASTIETKLESSSHLWRADTWARGGTEIFDLELGVFASELSQAMLTDLSRAGLIGVKMMTDWRKPSAHISFTLHDCPSLIFHLYTHELGKIPTHQEHFVSANNLRFGHKFKRRQAGASQARQSIAHSSRRGIMFKLDSLILCWTRLDLLQPFQVPCDVHEYLRQIYIGW